MNIRSIRYTLFSAGIALVAAGCGDGVDPDVTGLLNAEVHDTPAGTGAFTGTAAGNMQVSIRSTGGTWVDVGSPNGITVELQSTTPTSVHGSTSVASGTYDRVRLTLSDVTFSVDAGGTIESIVLNADASALAAGDADVALEISVTPFTVSSSAGTATVSFDLNVQDWLTNAMLTAQVIAEGDLTGQLTATSG